MSARDSILKRLKSGTFTHQDVYIPPVAGISRLPGTDVTLQFATRLRDTNAEVRICTESGLIQALLDWYLELGSPLSWVSQTSSMGEALWQHRPETANWVDPKSPMDGDRSLVFHDIDLGITESHSAIFETGTVVLIPNGDEPRTMSLVPPMHLVVVRSSGLVPRFEDWIQKHPECATHTNVVLITGPSKTADIQQTIAYGAHGPKQFFVLLVS